MEVQEEKEKDEFHDAVDYEIKNEEEEIKNARIQKLNIWCKAI